MFAADLIQYGSRKDGKDIGNGKDRNGKCIIIRSLMTGHAFIDLGKRYSPCAIAAAHDGKHVVEDNHGWRDAKEKAPYNA